MQRKLLCPDCHGRGSDVEAQCSACAGSGFDPEEDNPFAQCHECYGEGTVTLPVCQKCGGVGILEEDDTNEDDS